VNTQPTDLTGAIWHKSSRSNNGGACVEVAANLPNAVTVRDSKDRQGPKLTVTDQSWSQFIQAVKRGEFDR
jgi:Domain of unknown function (DUF397)